MWNLNNMGSIRVKKMYWENSLVLMQKVSMLSSVPIPLWIWRLKSLWWAVTSLCLRVLCCWKSHVNICWLCFSKCVTWATILWTCFLFPLGNTKLLWSALFCLLFLASIWLRFQVLFLTHGDAISHSAI